MIGARIKIVAVSLLCASAAVCLAYAVTGFVVSRSHALTNKEVVLVAALLQFATACALILAWRTNRK